MFFKSLIVNLAIALSLYGFSLEKQSFLERCQDADPSSSEYNFFVEAWTDHVHERSAEDLEHRSELCRKLNRDRESVQEWTVFINDEFDFDEADAIYDYPNLTGLSLRPFPHLRSFDCGKLTSLKTLEIGNARGLLKTKFSNCENINRIVFLDSRKVFPDKDLNFIGSFSNATEIVLSLSISNVEDLVQNLMPLSQLRSLRIFDTELLTDFRVFSQLSKLTSFHYESLQPVVTTNKKCPRFSAPPGLTAFCRKAVR